MEKKIEARQKKKKKTCAINKYETTIYPFFPTRRAQKTGKFKDILP